MTPSDLAERINLRLLRESDGNIYLDIAFVRMIVNEEAAALPTTPAPLDVERLATLIDAALDAYPPRVVTDTRWNRDIGRKVAPRYLAAHILASLSTTPAPSCHPSGEPCDLCAIPTTNADPLEEPHD